MSVLHSVSEAARHNVGSITPNTMHNCDIDDDEDKSEVEMVDVCAAHYYIKP